MSNREVVGTTQVRRPVPFTRVRSAEGSVDTFKRLPRVVSRSTSDAALRKLLGLR